MTADDRTLLIRTRKGHEPSARALWDRFAPRLRAVAFALTRSETLTDDAVQSVFCSVLERSVKELRAIDNAEAWLVRSTRNAALNMVRTDARRRDREQDRMPIITGAAAPDDELRAALDSLEPERAEVIMLKHAASLTFDQIALALDCNRSTAAARYRAGIEQLRTILSAHHAAAGAS